MADPTSSAVLQFCPRCGAEPFARKAANHLVCAACSFEWYINPAVAAACFIFDDRNQILLIRRQKDPGKGLLAPPGGFIDVGETAEAGARREVQEETGLSLEAVKFLCSQPNTYAYGGYTYNVLDLFFTARVPAFRGVKTGEDVSGLVVQSAAEVDPAVLAFPSMQAAWRHHLSGRG
ncbi:MAG: NUDIX domain-containing protein [Lacunisphaera sp.]|nr:NUDIX domain-containing protein [Lacunisphaera sp.]